MTYHNGVLKNPLLYVSSPSKPIPFCVHLAIQNTIPTKPAPCTTTRPILKQTSPRVPLHPVAQSGFGQKSGYQEGSVTRIKRRLHLCTLRKLLLKIEQFPQLSEKRNILWTFSTNYIYMSFFLFNIDEILCTLISSTTTRWKYANERKLIHYRIYICEMQKNILCFPRKREYVNYGTHIPRYR